jgi:hypothetical protein
MIMKMETFSRTNCVIVGAATMYRMGFPCSKVLTVSPLVSQLHKRRDTEEHCRPPPPLVSVSHHINPGCIPSPYFLSSLSVLYNFKPVLLLSCPHIYTNSIHEPDRVHSLHSFVSPSAPTSISHAQWGLLKPDSARCPK